jgi:alkanesulfonate monooxygenase SsuD/methylene tetrahydromethanopterin reductase-like flavin-dependent oxidoreductase (luciferase family)
MNFGSFMEFHTREGSEQEDAFQESFDHVSLAEELGLDTIWLAESHFSPSRSVLSAPLVLAAAIAGRTKKIKIGTAVQILPLGNPLRIAEEVATLDHVSGGRFEFGVGRSGLPSAYNGYKIPYTESREIFYESMEIIKKAFTEESFSYQGKYNSYDDVCLTPKPLQKPHPPMRIAATTSETFTTLGEMGIPIFVGVRGLSLSDVAHQVILYREALKRCNHATGSILLRVPVHVADTTQAAMANAEGSFMKQFRRLGSQLGNNATASLNTEGNTSRSLSEIDWKEIQGEKVAVGDPETVATQIKNMMEVLTLDGIAAEFNAGEQIPAIKVRQSLELFCKEVIPKLR